MKRVICINGAPRSGKDAVAGIMVKYYQRRGRAASINKFAAPLDRILKAVLGLEDNDDDDAKYRQLRELNKDEPFLRYGGETTIRKLLIGISEDLIKPQLGKLYFAKEAADEVIYDGHPYDRTFIFSDSGFQYEYDEFQRILMRHGNYEIHLLQVSREGRNFDNDSREHVFDTITYYVNNDGTLEDLKLAVHELLDSL